MIRSMTGYGQGHVMIDGCRLEVGLRSVNHKFCEVSAKLPKLFLPLESEVKKRLQKRFNRGRLDLQVTLNGTKEYARRLEVDLDLARQYRQALQKVKNQLNVKGEVDLALLINFRSLITVEEQPLGHKHFIRALYRVLDRAADQLDRMRQREGRALAKDLTRRLGRIRKSVEQIKRRAPKGITEYRDRLAKKIKWLTEGTPLDAQRLEQEVAFYAVRSDINEEMTRMESHLSQFKSMMMTATEAVGRSLDFLIQELHREINTAGSKAGDITISRQVVLIKSELERLREQVQNVE